MTLNIGPRWWRKRMGWISSISFNRRYIGMCLGSFTFTCGYEFHKPTNYDSLCGYPPIPKPLPDPPLEVR